MSPEPGECFPTRCSDAGTDLNSTKAAIIIGLSQSVGPITSRDLNKPQAVIQKRNSQKACQVNPENKKPSTIFEMACSNTVIGSFF